MVLKEKEAKECVAYYRRDLTSITFCLVSLDRKRAVCTRHQGILMTCHNNPTIERNFAINNPSFSSALRRSNYRLRIRLSLVAIISGIEKSLSTEAGRNWKKIGKKRSFSWFVLFSWHTMCCHVPLLRFFVSSWPTSTATNEKHWRARERIESGIVPTPKSFTRSLPYPVFFLKLNTQIFYFILSFNPNIVTTWKRNSSLFSCIMLLTPHNSVSTMRNDGIVCRLNKTSNLNKSAIRIEAQGQACACLFLNCIR